jgi:hypothetical protein
LINDKDTGEVTYSEIQLKTGTYTFELQNPNYSPVKGNIKIEKDKTIKIIANLSTGDVKTVE